MPLMHAPRRHSRRLLLPPGWVALGFLLLLGCQALLAHRQQISIYSKLELAMPMPEKMAAEYPAHDGIQQFSNLLSHLKSETQWSSVNFNGRKLNDFLSDAMTANAVQAMRVDTVHARGARIYFRPCTTYGNLVSLLDLMNRLGQPRYWLDVEHQPTAFYAVNSQAVKPIKEERLMSRYVPFCISPVSEKYEPPIPIPSAWQVAQQNVANLWQQPWRFIAILIALIAVLSFYRLAHLRLGLR